MTSREQHDRMANAIRFLSMDAVEKANSGHPGLPMGCADIATVLFTRFLKFDPKAPHWADRDRFILSAGHGSMLLYSLLHLTGYEDMTIDQIKKFRQLGSKTAGHPEYGHAEGIETTTGPLGQGLANSVGFALGERIMNAAFGNDLVDHYTYVLAGDGCLMEGVSQEAIALAGHLKLNKLIVFWDNNNISIDGPVSLADNTDQVARFQASGWNASHIDGQDPEAIAYAIEAARHSDKPTMIACKTTIGFGAPTKAGTNKAHGSPLGAEEIAGARKFFGWESAALRDSGRHPRCLARSRQGRRQGAHRLGRPPRQGRRQDAGRVRAPRQLASCRRISTPSSPTTRRSSRPTSRRSPPANRRKWRSKSSTARCRRPSAVPPT